MNPFSHLYECRDHEWLVLTVVDYTKGYDKVMEALGLVEHLRSPRYKTIDAVQGCMEEFIALVNAAFMTRERAEWVSLFREADVVCCELRHMREVTEDPQALVNHYFEEVTFPNGRTALMPNLNVEFSNYAVKPYTPTEGIGRDTATVLRGYGYSETELADLEKEHSIRM